MPAAMLDWKRSLGRTLRSVPGVRHAIEFLRRNAPVVNEAQIDQFHADGYIVFDPMLPEAVIDQAIRDIAPRDEITKDLHHGSRVFDGWTFSKSIRTIALNDRVIRLLRQLYYREPLPFQTLNFPIGTEQKVHSDTIHFHSDPPTYMCGVWTALEDIDMQNGPLVYYPGSHKLPLVTVEEVAPGPGFEHYPKYEAAIEKLVKDKALTPHYAIIEKGKCFVWAANLLHGGSVHRDKGRTRHSQVTHYFFEGCQHYRPMDSYGGYRHMKPPKWIK
jgi:ectoine hydroxylase-related dioxygenase (phytanoyl-CoA dioxygenase family)